MLQESTSLVHETFAAIFDKKDNDKDLFDDDMHPTAKNRMPDIMLEFIMNSPVLATYWPSIRQHGFAETMRMHAAVERTDIDAQQSAADRKAARQRNIASLLAIAIDRELAL
jgi:hypothetical protein